MNRFLIRPPLLLGLWLLTVAPLAPAQEISADQAGLYPDEVVAMQLKALQNNDEADSGIVLTWEYTSPANQQANGPFPRFARMIHQSFADLLNSREFEVGAAHAQEGGASVPVRLICAEGATHGFIFWLSREHAGERDGHWLTEGVSPVRLPQQPPQPPSADSPAPPPAPPRAI